MAVSGLRILIVNHCHPATPHVCATRAREFANALARRGNPVLLTTEARDDAGVWESATALEGGIRNHDWVRPLVVACRPVSGMWAAKARQGLCGPVLGPLAIALAYLRDGTVFPDWTAGTAPYVGAMAAAFRPDIVWAIFGNTGAWVIGREIAAAAGCPWAMDVKDSWPRFVPAGLRGIVANRFGDAAGATAFSRAHGAEVADWFGRSADVVYSGIPDSFLHETVRAPGDSFVVLLTGAVRPRAALDTFIEGLAAWAATLDAVDRSRLSFAYFGADGDAVDAAARRLDEIVPVTIHGFRPLDELRRAMLGAGINVYIRSGEVPFHHKVFEVLSAGRPILCVPGERDEADGIAARLGLSIDGAATADDIKRALARSWADRDRSSPPISGLAEYTWDAQAEILEAALRRAAGKGA